ncbi:hypothetical protein [Gallibacterium anatis]|nr:hypothetical protein [Gallibacterium anatis]
MKKTPQNAVKKIHANGKYIIAKQLTIQAMAIRSTFPPFFILE